MRLYGEAERILAQEAAIMPLNYGRRHRLTKPWVQELAPSALGGPRWKDVIIEPHS
jgi:ABC-type oligopeptide transport system substrate-binding subunit